MTQPSVLYSMDMIERELHLFGHGLQPPWGILRRRLLQPIRFHLKASMALVKAYLPFQGVGSLRL